MTKEKQHIKRPLEYTSTKRIPFILLGLILLIFGLQSCDQNRFFEQNIEINNEKWVAGTQEVFNIDIHDTTSLFNFYLNIRNTTEYPYANLYVFVETVFPDNEIAKDTIELQLADIRGKWLGSGSGKYKYNQFILRKAMRFVQTGTYEFRIEQGMRKDTLTGISDVGIRMEYYP